METPTQKLTGINAITSTLNRGSYGDQVKALQQYLNGLGYDVGKVDSVYGPKVEAAVKQYQLDNGLKSDGVFGPMSLGKAKTIATTNIPAGDAGIGKPADDPSYMFNTDTGELNPNFIPKTQKELDQFYNASALAHPIFKGNSAEALASAAETGDFSGLYDSNGQPFSNEDQAAAVKKAEDALAPGFEATKTYDTLNTEEALSQKKADYEKSLATDKENFLADKTALDTEAANKGVLFSGGRLEREKKLQNAYQTNQDYNRAGLASSVGGLSRDYEYKYGNNAGENPRLSQYYQVGGNTYNANTARNGVGNSSLSKIYSPGTGFQGTAVNANKTAAQVRAAGLLANKGNKLLASSYNNQF